MNSLPNIDALLVRWAERGFNQSPVRRIHARGLTGLSLKVRSQHNAVGASAAGVRSRTRDIAKRTPQVMVRISGGGRGMRHVRAHLAYITRNGKLPAIDQDEDRHLGKDELKELGDEFQFGGFPVADLSARREALNIILSMPEGTDAEAVRRAVMHFAADEFSGHQYAMVLHSYGSDPDKDPARHPHVHLCVKAMGDDGRRLNPRKQDLQRWRERFAEKLQEHGVDAAASSRLERLQQKRGERQSVLHKRARGESLHTVGIGGVETERAAQAQHLEKTMIQRYKELTHILAESTEHQDWTLAVTLATTLRHTHAKFERQQGRLHSLHPDEERRK